MGKGSKKKPAPEKPDWQKLEEIVAEIQKELAPNAEVHHNHKIKGKSGIVRQLDVTISEQIGAVPILIVFEAKRYTRPVSVERVESFVTKLRDIGASRGVMVSNTGFTAGTKAVAKQYDVILRTYREAEVTDWSKLVGPGSWTIISDFDFKDLKVYATLDGYPNPIETSFHTVLFRENGEDYSDAGDQRFTLSYLFWNWWDEEAERPRKIGQLIEVPIDQFNPPVYVQIQDGRLIRVHRFLLRGIMTVKQYPVGLQVSEGNVLEYTETQTPEYLEVTTQSFNIDQIRENQEGIEPSPEQWEKFDKPNQLGFTIQSGTDYRFRLIGGTEDAFGKQKFSKSEETSHRKEVVQEIDDLRNRLFAKYGYMSDSTELLREDRAR